MPRLSLPALRMRFFAAEIAGRPWGQDVLLAQVRYRCRGWNGHYADPVHDTTRALDALARLAPRAPVVLIGHSMGARAALAAAGGDTVRGVVALAPWCPPGEPVAHLRGKAAVFLHDEDDTVTSAQQTWAFARRARTAGAEVQTVAMPAGGHAMLRGAHRWHRLAADYTAAILTWGCRPAETGHHGHRAR
ncbi:alpha/beta fold hydrolase [Kitasatospora sp. NPDC098652]|uniref:alpha/beta fold hydrolase n=1 Tax=Kitasatospora sp. NPDC098652 TaxID=3364095 RepID=UPI0037FA0C75